MITKNKVSITPAPIIRGIIVSRPRFLEDINAPTPTPDIPSTKIRIITAIRIIPMQRREKRNKGSALFLKFFQESVNKIERLGKELCAISISVLSDLITRLSSRG